jgi:hypothetical protein
MSISVLITYLPSRFWVICNQASSPVLNMPDNITASGREIMTARIIVVNIQGFEFFSTKRFLTFYGLFPSGNIKNAHGIRDMTAYAGQVLFVTIKIAPSFKQFRPFCISANGMLEIFGGQVFLR